MKKQCKHCGAEFESKRGSIYCSKRCRINYNNMIRRSEFQAMKKAEKKPLKRMSQIDDINAQAKAQGITYGQFKALQYAAEHKITLEEEKNDSH